MNPQVKKAIIQFIADEYHLQPDNIDIDLDFEADLRIPPAELPEFFHRLQDALNISLPEEKLTDVHLLSDLFNVLNQDYEETG